MKIFWDFVNSYDDAFFCDGARWDETSILKRGERTAHCFLHHLSYQSRLALLVNLMVMMVKILTYPWQGREGQMAAARTCERGRVTRWGLKSGSSPWWSSWTRRETRSTHLLFPLGSSSAGSSACPLLPHRKLTFSILQFNFTFQDQDLPSFKSQGYVGNLRDS